MLVIILLVLVILDDCNSPRLVVFQWRYTRAKFSFFPTSHSFLPSNISVLESKANTEMNSARDKHFAAHPTGQASSRPCSRVACLALRRSRSPTLPGFTGPHTNTIIPLSQHSASRPEHNTVTFEPLVAALPLILDETFGSDTDSFHVVSDSHRSGTSVTGVLL